MQRLSSDLIKKCIQSVINYRRDLLEDDPDAYKTDDDSWGVIIDLFGMYRVIYCPYGNELDYHSLTKLNRMLFASNSKRKMR